VNEPLGALIDQNLLAQEDNISCAEDDSEEDRAERDGFGGLAPYLLIDGGQVSRKAVVVGCDARTDDKVRPPDIAPGRMSAFSSVGRDVDREVEAQAGSREERGRAIQLVA
jgi:hypothetical protein